MDTIAQLAHDLEWLGREAPLYSRGAGLPGAALTIDRQRDILRTAEKLERQLKNAIRYNPNPLVGVDYPLDSILESIADLLAVIEDIKVSALAADRNLPAKVKQFCAMIQNTFGPMGAEAA